jgi:hypothetical protein
MIAEWVLAIATVAIAVFVYRAIMLLTAICTELSQLRAEMHDTFHPSGSVGTPDSYGSRILGELESASFNVDSILTEVRKLTADIDAIEYERRHTPP